MNDSTKQLLYALNDTMMIGALGLGEPKFFLDMRKLIQIEIKKAKDTKPNPVKLTYESRITELEEKLHKAEMAKENWKHIATYNGGEVKAALQLLAEALGMHI